MSLLKFGAQDSVSRGGKKSLKIVFAIGAIAGVLAIRSTFAADISLNLGAPVEFGQGVVQTTACDDDITVTPFSTFVNAPGAGSHKFTSLKISGIDSSPGNCSGKTFLIKAYGDSGLLPLFSYTESGPNMRPADLSYDFVEITNNNGVFSWTSDGTDGDNVTNDADVDDINRDLTDTSFVISLSSEKIESTTITRTPLADAVDVKRITVETYDSQLLSNRTLSASQVGLFIGEAQIIDELCTSQPCIPYFTFYDYLVDLTNDDIDNFNNELAPMTLTRSQIISAFSFKFVYDPSAAENQSWSMQVNFLGEDFFPLWQQLRGDIGPLESNPSGVVLGFDGNVGAFVPYLEGGGLNAAILFSLNGELQNNLDIGEFPLYGDIERTVPIREFTRITDFSETIYVE